MCNFCCTFAAKSDARVQERMRMNGKSNTDIWK